eukprot:5130133-Lingulodinium_polyedra.AAC.1
MGMRLLQTRGRVSGDWNHCPGKNGGRNRGGRKNRGGRRSCGGRGRGDQSARLLHRDLRDTGPRL